MSIREGEKEMKQLNTILMKAAALLAFGIGVMAIYAGGKAILAAWPAFAKINWLTYYNFSMGLFTVVLTAPLIWKSSRLALTAAVSTFGVHSAVMILLQTVFRESVSPASLEAMATRITVWAIVLVLMLVRQWAGAGEKQKKLQGRRLSG
jgi:hypothetical protein